MKCNFCGKEVNEKTAFCPFCGEKMLIETPKRICPKCGCEIRDKDTQYCGACGYRLSQNEDNKDLFYTEREQTNMTSETSQNADSTVKNGKTFDKRKNQLKTATILGVVSAGIGFITTMLIFFLPFFVNTYYETIGEERLLREDNISFLKIFINCVKSIISNNISAYTFPYIIVFLVIFIYAGLLAFISIKDFIKYVKGLIKFEQYSTKELKQDLSTQTAQEVVKDFKKVRKANLYWGIIILMPFLGIWVDIKWGAVITIAIFALVASIIEKISEQKKKQAIQ